MPAVNQFSLVLRRNLQFLLLLNGTDDHFHCQIKLLHCFITVRFLFGKPIQVLQIWKDIENLRSVSALVGHRVAL